MFKFNIILLISLMTFVQSIGQNTFNLDPAVGSRFTVTDKVWPVNIGEGDVCLWSDDKLAAFTVTIDDNNEQNIPFWKTMIAKYGFHFTWFVITEAASQYNVQDWTLYNDLAALGSQIDGHDDRNWYKTPSGSNVNSTDAEYLARLQATVTKVNSEVTSGSNDCLTYAYPFGEGNVDEAKKVFIGIRGTQGILNQANTVNYLDVNSVSNGHIYTNDTNRDKYILPLLDKTTTLYGTNYHRGWGSTHFHGVDAAGETTTDEFLQYLADKPELWVAGFTEVAQYSQSFATHNLTIDQVQASEIKFTVTDDMLDSAFYFPLSVKIRIDNNWVNVSAVQNGAAVDAQIITNNGSKYALVKAVPDAGQVTLTGVADTDPAVITPVIGDKEMIEEEVLQVDFSASTTGSDAISFTASNLPSFGVLTDNGNNTGKIVFSPALFESGVYQDITVVANNGRSITSQSFQLTVTSDPSSVTLTASKLDAAVYYPVHNFVDSNNRTNIIGGGGYVAGKQMSPVFPFQLPALPEGKEVISAKFQVNLESFNDVAAITGELDLYGLPYRNSATVLVSDAYAGTFDADATASGLQESFATKNTAVGVVESTTDGNSALVSYLNTQYQAASAGDYVFLRLSNDDVNQTQYGRIMFTTADGAETNEGFYPTMLIQFGDVLDIDEVENQTIHLFPNPVKDGKLNVSLKGFDLDKTDIEIYSLTGSLVHKEIIKNKTNSGFVLHLGIDAGLYLVKISDGGKSVTQKLIVQ